MIREADGGPPGLRGLERRALTAGAGALVLAVLGGALLDAPAFFRAYLQAWLYVVGLAVGALGVALIYQLTGGRWGVAVERVLEAAARTIPWLAPAFVPIALQLPELYPWARPDVAAEPGLQHKTVYLNVPFFLARTAGYFAAWTALAWALDRGSRLRDRVGEAGAGPRLRALAAGGLVAYGLTATFAAIDWMMSLEPRWSSTVYGAMVGVGWMLSAFTLAVVLVTALAGRPPLARVVSPGVRVDLGNLLLTFTVLWTYLAFVQLLVSWAGNIPEEVSWYVARLGGGWQAVALWLALVQFLLPLLALLFRAVKRDGRAMIALGALLLVSHWVNVLWLVAPAFAPERFSLTWLDAVTALALAGLWLALVLVLLRRRPLVPLRDPALPLEVEDARR